MGRSALVSHEGGKKHIENLSNAKKSVSLLNFVSAKEAPVQQQPPRVLSSSGQPVAVALSPSQLDSTPSASAQQNPVTSHRKSNTA